MYTYVVLKELGLKRTVISFFEDENQAVNQLQQLANKLNCSQKIIWNENNKSFALLSNNGQTEKYYVMKLSLENK